MRISLFLLLILGSLATGWSQNRPPNIILFLCDDLRADALGCMGHPWVETPNIDALSAEGITFDQAFATTAICVTSRCNILTGQYAARSGWRHGDFRGKTLTAEQLGQTYLGYLKNQGYKIGYAGKWHIGSVPESYFDFNAAYAGQGWYYDKNNPTTHLTAKLASQAVEMVESDFGDAPFFLCVGFKAPHVQDGRQPPFYIYDEELVGHLYEDIQLMQPPLAEPAFFESQPDFLRRSLNRERWEYRLSTPELFEQSVKGYHRLVSGVDHAVGKILRALESSGRRENTVIIFTSDHGVYLGARGFAGKWLPHEPSIRIPLIVHDPREKKDAGGRRDQMALTIDLAPTILELAGAAIPESMQGRSLVPLLRGENLSAQGETWRSEFFYDHYYMPHRIPASEAVRTERWKYIRYVNSDPLYEELYDLYEDPLEYRNLIGNQEFEFMHEAMEEKWRAWREKVK